MSIKYIQKLPSVEEIRQAMPLERHLEEIKKQRDIEIAEIIKGKDEKLLLIIGPCSAHDEEAVIEYVMRLSRLQHQVIDKFILIPRIYTNKPRTTGTGYKGMLHQPNHQDTPDMARGLKAIRKLHLRALSESHLLPADEMLYPGNYPFLDDILSYVAVGARSAENQQHRLTVSGMDIAAGMKNPTSGDVRVMLDSVFAAQSPHIFAYNGWEVATEGNALAHAILRGAVDQYGNHIPNYHYEDLMNLAEMYVKRGLVNPAVIVDCNHSNSGRKYSEQPRIAKEIMHSRRHSKILKDMIKGFMIESFLLSGSQEAAGNEFGKSITDPCLGWEESEKLIFDLAELV